MEWLLILEGSLSLKLQTWLFLSLPSALSVAAYEHHGAPWTQPRASHLVSFVPVTLLLYTVPLFAFPLGHWTALSVLYWEPLTSICSRDDWGFSCVERPTFPHPSTQGLSHIYNWLLHQYLQMEWMEPDTQIPTENGLTVSVRKCCCMGWNRVTIGNMDGCLLRGHCWTKGITAMDWQEVTLPESLRQDLLTGHTVLGGLPKFLFMPIKMFDSVFPQDAFLTQSV